MFDDETEVAAVSIAADTAIAVVTVAVAVVRVEVGVAELKVLGVVDDIHSETMMAVASNSESERNQSPPADCRSRVWDLRIVRLLVRARDHPGEGCGQCEQRS